MATLTALPISNNESKSCVVTITATPVSGEPAVSNPITV